MGICQQCAYFRRSRPASQLFAAIVDSTDAAITKALTQIQESEVQQKGYEAQYKSRKDQQGDENWGFRPAVSSYCGYREGEGVFLIAEIKNFGGRCEHFSSDEVERRSCHDCVHCIHQEGSVRDFRVLEMMKPSALKDAGPGMGVQEKYMGGIGPRKAFEISSAYQADGILASKPEYLDYCMAYSREDEYVVCIMRNPNHNCPAWSPGGQSPDEILSEEALARQGSQHAESVVVENNGLFKQCGGFSFYLDNVSLVVLVDDAALSQEEKRTRTCSYDCRQLPVSRWVTLLDEDGSTRAIHVCNDRGKLRIQVGSPPEENLPQMGAWSKRAQKEWQPGPERKERSEEGNLPVSGAQNDDFSPFEVQMDRWPHYAHPASDFSFVWRWPDSSGRTNLQVFYPVPPGGYSLFDVTQLTDGQWVALQDDAGGLIPLEICRRGNRLIAKWLP